MAEFNQFSILMNNRRFILIKSCLQDLRTPKFYLAKTLYVKV